MLIFSIVVVFLLIIVFFMFGVILPSNPISRPDKEDNLINISGHEIRIKHIDRSSEITMVFLHSFGSRLEMWEPLSSFFPDENLLLIDMIGFGKSAKPRINYSLEAQSHFLIKILDHMGVSDCIVVGSSMGASLALWTGAKYPDRVTKLILFAPSAYPGSMRHRFPGHWFYRPGLLNNIGRLFVSSSLFRFVFPNSLGSQALTVTASYNNNFIESLKMIKQPTLILWSVGDDRCQFSFSKAYIELLDNAKLIVKPAEAGHNIPSKYPSETAKEMKDFLYN